MKKIISIAIVEDNQEMQEMLVDLLNSQNDFMVIGAFDDKKNALKNIPLLKPNIVLIDIGLPDGSGIEIIKNLKPDNPEIEYMVCTNFEDDIKVMEALEAGASSYLLKRCKPEFIINSVKELYDGGSPMSPDVARIVIKKINNYERRCSVEILTKREKEIIDLLAHGNLYKEVADTLGISINTLKAHCYKIYKKLHVNNKVEAINKVYKTLQL